MALGFSSSVATSIIDAYLRNQTYTPTAAVWMKLHTGAPGSAGTTSAATETTRKQITCSAASSGSISNSGALTWTNVAGSETYTHFSLWDASTSGTFLGSGTMTANAVTAGDTFTVAISGFTATLSVAS